jgi:formamidopyrimidine-DNA glycosylase
MYSTECKITEAAFRCSRDGAINLCFDAFSCKKVAAAFSENTPKETVMPELPDLTVFSENLSSKLTGKRVTLVEYHKVKRLNVTPDVLQNALVNTTLDTVRRSGKEIELLFSGGPVLSIHLMLSGGFTVTQTPESVKFKVLTMSFEDGMALVVNDPRGLTVVNLNPVAATVPDALEIDGDYVRMKISTNRSLLAKAFLIDQSIVRGIGNAYADEILWLSRISPKSIMGKLPDANVNDLISAIRSVLIEAISEIKKINPDVTSGEIRDFLKIHNPDLLQSPNGRPIIKEQVATKTTYSTDEQILYV